MSHIAIRVEGLGKRYKIGHRKSGNLREALVGMFPRSRVNQSTNQPINKEFWALRDINFEVKQGEAVGIIGRNGAGKSTLLKILSRITKPTTGRFEINGRVSSLLEVGTGFHMELTGRENIYLNGTILGMKRREIKEKFDEIVAFSGVEEFIDTPVKHYSSGMKVRLAFSVAAHLEPEILIIDEVLAVGDAEFQKKCLGKMEDVAGQGRTVLFVSHNMGAVRKLCTQGVVLEKSKIAFAGEIGSAVNHYLENADAKSGKILDLASRLRDKYKGEIKFDSVIFEKVEIPFGEDIIFTLLLRSEKIFSFENIDLGIAIIDKEDNQLIHLTNEFIATKLKYEGNSVSYKIHITDNRLAPGKYSLTLFFRTKDTIQDWLPKVASFEILDGNPYGFTHTSKINGRFFPTYRITVE